MEVTTTFHVRLGEDLVMEVMSKRGPEGAEEVLVPDVAILEEGRVPGLRVQERTEEGTFVVSLPVEALLRVAAAVQRLRERVEDGRALCPEHGFFNRGAEEFDQAVRTSAGDDADLPLCPRCREAALAADAAERLKAAGP